MSSQAAYFHYTALPEPGQLLILNDHGSDAETGYRAAAETDNLPE